MCREWDEHGANDLIIWPHFFCSIFFQHERSGIWKLHSFFFVWSVKTGCLGENNIFSGCGFCPTTSSRACPSFVGTTQIHAKTWNSNKQPFKNWLVVSNIFYFHPYLGKIPILNDIFQMGWNHQLENGCFNWIIPNLYIGEMVGNHRQHPSFFCWLFRIPRYGSTFSGPQNLRVHPWKMDGWFRWNVFPFGVFPNFCGRIHCLVSGR